MTKNLVLFVFIAWILQACGGTQNNSAIKQDDRNDKILSHCTLIRNYGKDYANLRAMGYEAESAQRKAADTIIKQYQLSPSKRLTAITTVYASFIELQAKHSPDTTGYFVLTQCLAIHANKKTLPNDTKEGRKQIDNVLASCENKALNEDELGACILNSLRPLTIPLGS